VAEAPAYFDTSLIAPLYRSEPLTAMAEALQEEYRPVVSVLTELEMASTVARWVRMGELTQEQAASIDRVFGEDLRVGAFECVELGQRAYWQARNWLQRQDTSLRTLDALHLAVAAEQGWPILTADRQLHNAAQTLGCKSQLAE
jgi:predicted nucleic acid-binding protein